MTTERAARGTLAYAGAANLLAGVIGAAVNLVLAALVGRHLGPDGAGVYFIVVAAFLIASNTLELGADTGLVRFVAAARALERTEEVPLLVRAALRPVLVVGASLAAVAAAVLLVVAPLEAVSPVVLAAAAPVAIAASVTALMLGVTRGFADPLTYPLLQNVLLPVGRVAGVGVAVLAGWGVSGVLAAWLTPVPVVLLLATVVAARTVRRHASPAVRRVQADLRPAAEVSGAFWRFSSARGVTATVEILLEWADVLIVGALTSPAAAGVYAVVTRCARAGEVVQQAARIAVGPRISEALARGDVATAGQVYGLVTAAMVWLSWPFFILLAVYGDVVLTVFGDGFDEGAVPLAVLAAAMALATAAGTVQTILLMGGRSTWQLADKTAALLLNVVLNLVLVPTWGITGAAVAWAVTISVDTAVVVWQVQGLMRVRPDLRPTMLAAALSLGLVLAPAAGARAVWGASSLVLGGVVAVLAVLHLGAGLALRRRLGLPELLAVRSSPASGP